MFLEKRSVSWKYSDFKHNHLEELEIAGFEADDKYMD